MDLHYGALSPNLIESELFGYVKGAFTGANRERTGKFQLADGRTLFLDEISTIGPEIQRKLLKVIEEKTFFPVGSDEAVQVDVRVIAATNQSLLELVRKKQFREDLYYRLKLVTFCIPPLRARKTDIPLLVKHFLEQFNRIYHTRKSLSGSALERLIHAPWEGNIRELAHVLESAVVLSYEDLIQEEDLDLEDIRPIAIKDPEGRAHRLEEGGDFKEELVTDALHRWFAYQFAQENHIVEEFERTLLHFAWKQYHGNKKLIAQKLHMSRSTLYRLLEKYSIK